MLPRVTWPVIIVAVLFIPIMSQGLPPVMNDDPGVDTCLGPDDPFCPQDDGGGSTGGGSGGTCYHCGTKTSETFDFTAAGCCSGFWSCLPLEIAGYNVTGSGDSCEVKLEEGSANQYCDLGSSCLSNLVAGSMDTENSSLVSSYFESLEATRAD